MNSVKLHLDNARRLTNLLDTRFSILGFRFGLDPLLSLIPSLGSMLGAVTSFYIFWIGIQANMPKELLVKMFINIIIDLLLGSVPVAGVIFDAFYKSNVRNLSIIEEYLGES